MGTTHGKDDNLLASQIDDPIFQGAVIRIVASEFAGSVDKGGATIRKATLAASLAVSCLAGYAATREPNPDIRNLEIGGAAIPISAALAAAYGLGGEGKVRPEDILRRAREEVENRKGRAR